MTKHTIYLASPFFNSEQISTVEKIENAMDYLRITYFSPRRSGINIRDLKPQEREVAAEKVFRANVDNIDDALFVLACIDDRDSGTAWEIGYAYARNIPVITFSAKGYGANVMLSRSTKIHLDNIDKVVMFLKGLIVKEQITYNWLFENIGIVKSMMNDSTLKSDE